ncbi:autotransporter domain-containing protein [Bradyrhizobium sp. GCM10027634]|uniref:autotransporter domain-containing protein n=1 Tax=unclassified Bradyrhizobium TaxID=2631580 RepID=UPI00188D708E|nr:MULTISPECIES: autotransporter domain-containing protein [unclassified Bradyrhizobium]MDN5001497.1 autotransporter domain-containing protein [Bradyrhizobium sp. WYCCWR 12677]
MKTGKDCFKATRRLRAALLTSSALTLAWALPAAPAQAQDATWLASPATNVYSSGANWDTGTAPTGTAYFGATNSSHLAVGGGGGLMAVGGWTFTAGAPAYTFDNYNLHFVFDGAGIVANGTSVTINNANTGSQLFFHNSSTAGSAVIANLNNNYTIFYDTSSAGTASITNTFSFLIFRDSSTAGSASITHNSGTVDFAGSSSAGTATITSNAGLIFLGSSTAGSASITSSGIFGATVFIENSTAGSASITVNNALTFADNSTAGSATLLNNASGVVDFSYTTGPNGDHRISAGSIAGAGSYNLGANELTVGSNNLSTEVSGVIADGGYNGGTGGSLVKIGTGTLKLSGNNTFTGGVTLSAGALGLASNNALGTGVLTTYGGTVAYADGVTIGNTIDLRGSTTLDVAAGSATQAGAIGQTGGAFGIVKTGTGALTLSGNNTFTGGVTLNAGTLGLAHNNALGTGVLTTYGGTIAYADGVAIGNTIDLRGSTTLDVATGGATQAGAIGETGGASGIVKTGAGRLTLSGANTYTGGTTINAGTLQLGGSGGGVGSIAGTVTVGASGTFDVVNADARGITSISNSGITNFRNSNSAGGANITNDIGSTILFYDTSSAGGATINNTTTTATLNFLNSSTAGSATITNSGGFSFSNSSTAGSATINNISDYMHGQFTVLNFHDSSTAGRANINNDIFSTINFQDSSTAGGATITNANAARLNFLNNATAGSAAISNTGNISFQDSSSAGSATIDSVGFINFSNAASAGSAHITGGGIGFTNTSTAGNATIINNNGGLGFGDRSSAGNATIVSSINLQLAFEDNATAGSATITNNGSMMFRNQATGGDAAITITGTGSLYFGETSTAGHATILNHGQTVFDATSTAGSADITNDSALSFSTHATAGSAAITNNSNVLFLMSSNAGNAELINSTSGAAFDFSRTSGANGDRKLTAGSLSGRGVFALGGNELTVGSNNLSTTVTGVIVDGGSGGGTGASLVKVGTGRLTLSGVNSYTGATTVDGGTLAVNGDITASSGVSVNSGGVLGGTGIVGNTTIASGGALAPGNSVGTLTVSGNLTFSAGSSYTVEVSAAAADRTNVSGTATLTGATVQAVAATPASFRSQTFTILTATGGFSGTEFAGLSVSGTFNSARNPHLTYNLNNVYLVLDPGTLILPSGSSGNQTGVAGSINKAVEGGAAPPVGFDALLNMSDAQLARALNQVSGQPGAASTQAAFNAMQQFLGMLDPLGNGMDTERGMTGGATDGGTLSYAATAQGDARVREAFAAVTPREAGDEAIDRRWGVWASAYGGASNLSGNAAAGSSSTTSRIYGTVVGADYRLSPDTLVGFALGGAGFNFSVADALGGGRADVFQAGLYARHNFGPAYLSAALAYGWQDVTTDRTVTVSGTDRLTANFKASTFAGRLETGWRFAPIPASSFGVTPYAAAQVTTFHLPGYGETALVGSNQFALSYGSQDTTNVRTELGTRTDQSFLVDNGLLTLRGRLAWAHDTNTNRLVSAAFQSLPGAAFTVNGAQPAADSALVGGRAEMKWRNGLSLAGTIEGEFSRSTQTYAGKGTVRYEW